MVDFDARVVVGFGRGDGTWLAWESVLVDTWRGFRSTSELELEADSGGFVVFEVEDRGDEEESELGNSSLSFRDLSNFKFSVNFSKLVWKEGRIVRTCVGSGSGGGGGSGTSIGSIFKILRGRNESLTSFKKASASATFGAGESGGGGCFLVGGNWAFESGWSFQDLGGEAPSLMKGLVRFKFFRPLPPSTKYSSPDLGKLEEDPSSTPSRIRGPFASWGYLTR